MRRGGQGRRYADRPGPAWPSALRGVQARIVPCPTPAHQPAAAEPAAGPAAPASRRRPARAHGQARPAARHRPGAAPAAALRGRNPADAAWPRCARARRRRSRRWSRQPRSSPRTRRQLVVRLRDDSGELVLRFLHFYPSQQKSLAPGARVRVRGEVRGGFFGREMVHPAFKRGRRRHAAADGADAGVPEQRASCRRPTCARPSPSALARAPLHELLPPALLPRGPADPARGAAVPAPPAARCQLATLEDHSHPAWQRLKFEELLAQQLSQLQAQRERARLRAPALRGTRPAGCSEHLLAALPFALTAAQQRVGGRDRRRPGARRSRCTGCCRATSARARRWWRRWPRRWPSMPAGNAR